jgi:hypothetical protein
VGLGWLTGGASLWQLSFCKGHTFTHKKAHVCLRLHIKRSETGILPRHHLPSPLGVCVVGRYSYLSRGTKVKNGATPLSRYLSPTVYLLHSAFMITHHTTHITDHIFHFLLLFVVFAVTSDSPKDDLPVRWSPSLLFLRCFDRDDERSLPLLLFFFS